MTDTRGHTIGVIRTAFQGVVLGSGIGLHEADGLDSHAMPSKLEMFRQSDEKHDWSKISAEDLNTYWWGLSHLDPDGMRFYLPAYMIADLNGVLEQDITFHLTHLTLKSAARFAAFTAAQMSAVLQYLEWRLAQCEYPDEPVAEDIRRANREFWSQPT